MQNRLQELLTRIGLSLEKPVCDRLLWYLDEMLRWNRRINLTAIENKEEALEKHLLDSLTVVPLLRGDERLLDMGSGAGLPSIPIKIARPQMCVLSVDSVHKKIVFQQHVARQLKLQGFEARACRIQSLSQGESETSFDVVTARALTHLSDLLSMAEPLLNDKGRLIAMKGPDGEAELAECAQQIRKAGFVAEPLQHLSLPLSGSERTLVVLKRKPGR
ncbi:16S rRNA (7-methyl-G527)-methyltransferase [Syntrophotalea carbinolica DSM 2380]|uniref:Ribosomal RNA small subunit methyltransferase G n=1 Tax=Syntrophotalea carbinolica (strain DSM 2380 / NBRC 103641 / GraBd1) TaxID=338963 RepID=RSMG_SYNC1|nr:16S rRNA (guanine(527)-N(7))-methyltransferase RsmG [Syntrophotalea carbinolica]Q39ZT2.1 RecName: Full=Ribosomal RNA small subunit methyltransferase G; AltName: Full=16S rRNA 7-methylguanosine methyltransferase; Short=16S rRNA m7G methyltransferase [Syntrophotalea carbinolica DSM 2380]ABA90375.1 16S rRNA (7-methyl-G527)-methyltransferase [Syntrophotalea carbinolica DSM 2380]